jgi:hypothetical protein
MAVWSVLFWQPSHPQKSSARARTLAMVATINMFSLVVALTLTNYGPTKTRNYDDLAEREISEQEKAE